VSAARRALSPEGGPSHGANPEGSEEEWGEVSGDDVMAAALLDRLVHHCHLVTIRGNTYRMRQHTELWQSLHAAHDGGRDVLRLVLSSICQIFNRRICRISAGVDNTVAARRQDIHCCHRLTCHAPERCGTVGSCGDL